MVSKNVATYDPPGQNRSVLLYWRLPEEWAEVLHGWVCFSSAIIEPCLTTGQAISTGQLNTILTFYEITDPPIPSPLSNIPITLLRKAIAVLAKTGRSQLISIADGEGVRLFQGTGK
jgi:ESCRT-II complex subunit VPS25